MINLGLLRQKLALVAKAASVVNRDEFRLAFKLK
jgi:hypothetical protein